MSSPRGCILFHSLASDFTEKSHFQEQNNQAAARNHELQKLFASEGTEGGKLHDLPVQKAAPAAASGNREALGNHQNFSVRVLVTDNNAKMR